MKNIREIQYEKVRKVYQELARHNNQVPDINKIKHLVNQIIYSTERVPMSGNYRVKSYNNIDLPSLNAELGLIKADIEVIIAYFSALDERLRGLEFVNNIWKENIKHKILAAIKDMMILTSPIFVKGFTEELDTAAITDRNSTTLTVLEDGSITVVPVTSEVKKIRHRERDITIKRIGDESFVPTISGKTTSVVNHGEQGGVLMTLTGKRASSCGFRYELKTDTKGVNHITVLLGEETTGINVKVEISADKRKYTTVYDEVVRRSSVDIPIDTTDISIISVELTMDVPNVVLLGEVRYEFRLYKIAMMNSTRSSGGLYVTKKIPISNDISYVSLVAEDETIGDAVVKYYTTINQDSDENPIGFVSFDPHSTGSLVNMSNSTVSTSIAPSESDPVWNIRPIKKFGSPLYNVFDSGVNISTDDYTINNGKLVFNSTDLELVSDTIKLHRGYGDFVQLSRNVVLDKHTDAISYDLIAVDATDWVEPVELKIKVKELIDEADIENYGNNYRNKIRISWHIHNFEEIRIERDDGTEVHAFIEDVKYLLDTAEVVTPEEFRTSYTHRYVDSTYITFRGLADEVILDQEYHHYITFVATLKDYISEREVVVTLDEDSFNIDIAGETFVSGIDFLVQPNEYRIELLKTGAYAKYYSKVIDGDDNTFTSSTDINISYDFEEQGSTSTVYYETQVKVIVPTDVEILPFKAAEIANGNFHFINGEDVSTYTTYTLKQGWNIIQTTHPYPSAGEYDTNVLTEEVSSAGIIIPENIEIMRPYMDSMRQVSPFTLATLEPEEARGCFSYDDGKILVSFLPDFVQPDILNDPLTISTKGQSLICKKPILEVDYSNVGYTPYPEHFELEFAYKDKSKEKFIFIKIEIETREMQALARINKIGLNKYQEVTV